MFLDGFFFCNAHQRNIRHHENFNKFYSDVFRMNGDFVKINGLFLLSIFSILFFSTFLCIPFCFLPPSDLPYCFLFKSVILSFLFSYYSVLSASPLCSIPIQSVLFLLVFILLDPSI